MLYSGKEFEELESKLDVLSKKSLDIKKEIEQLQHMYKAKKSDNTKPDNQITPNQIILRDC